MLSWNVYAIPFKIAFNSDNINWEDKKIIISSKIEYIQILFQSGNIFSLPPLTLSHSGICFTTSDISNYWSVNCIPELKKSILNQDYYLAPIYINQYNIILGIFTPHTSNGQLLFSNIIKNRNTNRTSNSNSNSNDKQSSLQTTSFLACINKSDNNMINAILEHQYNSFNSAKKLNLFLETKNDSCHEKMITLEWRVILINCRNYLPRIDIIRQMPIKTKGFFQNLPNPLH